MGCVEETKVTFTTKEQQEIIVAFQDAIKVKDDLIAAQDKVLKQLREIIAGQKDELTLLRKTLKDMEPELEKLENRIGKLENQKSNSTQVSKTENRIEEKSENQKSNRSKFERIPSKQSSTKKEQKTPKLEDLIKVNKYLYQYTYQGETAIFLNKHKEFKQWAAQESNSQVPLEQQGLRKLFLWQNPKTLDEFESCFLDIKSRPPANPLLQKIRIKSKRKWGGFYTKKVKKKTIYTPPVTK